MPNKILNIPVKDIMYKVIVAVVLDEQMIIMNEGRAFI